MAPTRVMGYVSEFDNVDPQSINTDLLTDIHIHSINLTVDSDGHIQVGNESFIENCAQLSDSTTNVVLSIQSEYGVGSTSFADMASREQSRSAFVTEAVNLVQTYNLDGVDIDWEYPSEGESGFHAALMEELRDNLDGSHSLSIAVSPIQYRAEQSYQIGRLSTVVDYINVMTYDFAGGWREITAHNSPLNVTNENPDSVRSSAQWWSNQVSSEKLLIGIPAYARTFSGVSSDNNGLGQEFSDTGSVSWDVLKNGILAEENVGYEEFFDSEAQSPFLYSSENQEFITYDDPESVGLTAEFANSNGFGGVFMWNLAQDQNHELLSVMSSEFGIDGDSGEDSGEDSDGNGEDSGGENDGDNGENGGDNGESGDRESQTTKKVGAALAGLGLGMIIFDRLLNE